MTDTLHDAAGPAGQRPISSRLVVVLRIAKLIMGVVAITLLIVAAIFAFPNPIRSWFLSGVDVSALPNTLSLSFACFNSAVIGAAWYFVVDKLIRVVRTIQDGDPFVDANVKRMRIMWILIASAEIFRMISLFILSMVAGQGGDAVTMRVDIQLGTWFLVFVIAALSEAFRMGVELRRDQELTI